MNHSSQRIADVIAKATAQIPSDMAIVGVEVVRAYGDSFARGAILASRVDDGCLREEFFDVLERADGEVEVRAVGGSKSSASEARWENPPKSCIHYDGGPFPDWKEA